MTGNALHAAVAAGDRASVEEQLVAGASARAPLEAEGSLLRLAHARLDGPEGRAIFDALLSAARAELEGASRTMGLGLAPGSIEPGAASLRERVGEGLGVVLLEGPAALAAKSLAALLQAPRRESDVATRPVADAARLLFCAQLPGGWTAVPVNLTEGAPWNLGAIAELDRRGEGLAPLCRALAERAGARALLVEAAAYTVFGPAGTIERHTGEPEAWWVPDGDEASARRTERQRRLDAGLAELGVRLPAMRVHGDGHDVQLELAGLDASSVPRVDLVVLQELGEPAVDRRPAVAAAVPMVAPGGEAVLKEAPPPYVPPVAKPSAPPPKVPIVGSQAPPMVTEEVVENEVVSPPPEAPPPEAPPPSEPPPEPAVSPAPPLASAPPPMVSAAEVVPNEEPDA